MYPIFRFAKEFWIHRNAPALGPYDTHVSRHICWPWDIDPWMELNNGRTLTLYDLGRLPMAKRAGFLAMAARERWGVSVAGAVVRYRRRVRMFDRFEMRSRTIGFDARFFYVEQSMWRGEICCSQVVLRMAVTDRNGIVSSDRFLAALGGDIPQKPLPEWVNAWIVAEGTRPWPPDM